MEFRNKYRNVDVLIIDDVQFLAKKQSTQEILPLPALICPKCGQGEIVFKKSKKGTVFFGCNKYPDCSYALWDEPTGNTCPECGELLLKKITKNGEFEVCSNRTCNFRKEIQNQEKQEEISEN